MLLVERIVFVLIFGGIGGGLEIAIFKLKFRGRLNLLMVI